MNLASNSSDAFTPEHIAEQWFNAALEGKLDILKSLLTPSLLNLSTESGATAAHICADYKQPGCLEFLIDAGCDIDFQNKFGQTPAIRATLNADLSCLRLLLNAGCNLDLADLDGWCCVHYAAYRISSSFSMGLLIDAGADLHAITHRGLTVMGIASVHTCIGPLVQSAIDAKELRALNLPAGSPLKRRTQL